MKSGRKTWIWLGPAVAVFAVGLILAALYDLAIDQAVFSPQNPFAVVMEAVGWFPAFVPPIFLMTLWATAGGREPLQVLRTIGASLVAVGGAVGILYSAFDYFHERGFVTGGTADVWVWGLLLLFALLFVGGVAAALRMRKPLRRRLTVFALWGTAYFIANEAAVNLVKALWQRTRFDTMAAMGSFADFTPWFKPFGHGGSSFPSGHTANAAGVFVLILLCDFVPALGRHKRLIYAGCWVYIAAMATARILIGRHFLSDTLAAAALMGGLLYALRRLPPYQKSVAKSLIPEEGELQDVA